MPNVATPSSSQSAMADRSTLPRTLMAGTAAMRRAGETYLPKEPAEEQKDYDARLKRSTLFNAFGKTVADMTGKVFAKPVVLENDVPAQIKTYSENVDMTGRHINVFACDAFFDGMQTGIGYILTDMPPAAARDDDARPMTQAEQTASGVRPYLVYIPVERLIGWKSTTIAGAEVLTQVRILECVTEPDGEFNEIEIPQIRVIEPGNWRTFRKNPNATGQDDEWVQNAAGVMSLNKITIAPFYVNRTGYMTGAPPLEKLAELNVSHWQSQSDQRNILHVARVPILFGAGFDDDTKITVGVNAMVRVSSIGATLEYVEHSGSAIDSGDKDLQNIEAQMQAMGLQLMIPDPGKSATGVMSDDSKENSPLAMIARSLGDCIEASFGFMAEYMGLGVSGGSVVVNQDYGVQAGWHNVEAQMALDARNAGEISQETFWNIWQRFNILSDDFDAAVEKDRIAAEPPPLAGKPMDLNGPPQPAT